jgi:tetratricopeptide (TPR) repeat protein
MNKLSAIIAFALCLPGLPLVAQQTAVFTEANLAYKKGEDFFQKGVYGYALTEYENAVNLLLPVNEPSWDLLKMRAELGYAKSAVRLDMPDGEDLIINFIRKYKPDPLASQALLEVANYFYNAGKYDKAIDFYKQISSRDLTHSQRSEVYFKLGYSYFVRKKFKEAEANFKEVKDTPTEYFYPANYYYGLCKFFKSDYTEAIKSFRLVERSRDYKPHVPYYITQIYFAQRDFDEVIRYAEPKLSDRSLRKSREMNQLVGQAWFEKGDYQKALPFLEKYAGSSGRMREEEFYQLGYCQYQVGKYDKAAENFTELSSVNSALGQTALYYLADSRLKLKDPQAARSAFAAASKMSFEPEIQENALINYAKLSYELRFDRDALAALKTIGPGSRYYNEAQELMSDIFVNTRNYDQAIATLEGMSNKTPKLKEAYQKVLYLRGVQYQKDGNLSSAKVHFEKSAANAVNSEYKALALYWLGDIAHQQKDYNASIDYLNQYLVLAKTQKYLPDEASIFTASYLQGYNYLKKKNHITAQGYFRDAVNGIRRNRSFIKNKQVKETMLGDATLRAGDCLFKRNQYSDAIKYYDDAIAAKFPGFQYALFQKAIIEGLRGNNTDKLLALESLIDKYPRSEYADDAMFQLGITYQEIQQSSKATDALKRLVTDYPNSGLVNNALLRLGLVAYNSGNPQAAIDYYKQVFSHSPEPGEADAAMSALREIYIKDMGDSEAFASFLETVPGYKLDNIGRDTLAFDAAETAYESGNYERAVTNFTEYIRKFPNGIHILLARFHRGESYAVLKQYTPALQDYEWITGKGQGKYFVEALKKAAAIAYHNEQNFRKAYDYYSQFESLATSTQGRFEAQLGAMRAAYRLGDEAAVQSSARKVAGNPSASEEQVATAEFYLAKIAFDKKDYTTAMQSFQQVLQLSDNEQTAEARYLIAMIYYQQRDLEKAKQQCLENNNDSSNYPYWVGKSLLLLADVFAEQGDLFSAKTVLEALIENYETMDDDILPNARQKLETLNQKAAGSSRLETETDTNFMDNGNGGND